jgi:N-methylhydantoinase A
VLPQIREFYRLSTTVINAYIAPVMSRYLGRLERSLREMGVATPRLYIMQSNGGVATFQSAAKKPVATVLSGPAGGVIASVGISKRAGLDNIITFDMGGTSCDVALIHQGRRRSRRRGASTSGRSACPCSIFIPSARAAATIARIDAVGGVQVGPDSAGADPGPICYGKGGEEVTVTDANLVAGVLHPTPFSAGACSSTARRPRKF